MGRIYSATRKVNIWLGPEDYFTRPALQLAMKMQGIGQMQARAVRHLADDEVSKELGLPNLTSSVWWCLFAFLHRSWFRRAWVVQELSFAPKVQLICGLLTFTWSTLTRACAILFESRMGDTIDVWAWLELAGPAFDEPLFLEDLTPILVPRERPDSERNMFTTLDRNSSGKSYQNVIRLEAARVGDGSRLEKSGDGYRLGTNSTEIIPSIPILHMLDASRRFEATEPHDKIYSILSLAERDAHDSEYVSEHRRRIEPDYRLAPEEVFIEAAWYTLLSGNDLEILMRTYMVERAGKDEKHFNLPSWVPDWTTSRAETPLWTLTPYRNSKWSASGNSYWSPPGKDVVYKKCLPVQGLLVDILEEVVVSDHFSLSKSGEIAVKLQQPYPGTEHNLTTDEVLWRTLIANNGEDSYPAPSDYSQIFYDSWMDENREVSREYHTEKGMADKDKEDDYYRFVHQSDTLFPRDDVFPKRYWARQEQGDENPTSPATIKEEPPKAPSEKLDSESEAKRKRLAALRPFSVEEGNRPGEAESQQAKGPTILPQFQGPVLPLSQVEQMTKDMFKRAESHEVHSKQKAIDDGHKKPDSSPEISASTEVAPSISKPTKVRPAPSKMHREFDRLKSEFSPHRRLFRSKKHHLGNGPKCSRPGDEIWLLAGAKVPFVLRPYDDGKYLLVGDAYVHGIMHGEAFDGLDSSLITIELV